MQTLSAFTHTLLTPYDTQSMLEELTERAIAGEEEQKGADWDFVSDEDPVVATARA